MSRQLIIKQVLLLAAVVFFIFSSAQADEEITGREVIENTLKKIGLPEIADEQNGAFVYREIFKLKDSLREKYKELSRYFPYQGTVRWNEVPEEEKNKVVDLILHNPDFAKLYQLLEKASKMECVFFAKEEYRKNVYTISDKLLSILARLRSCARDLAEKVKIEAEYGDINKALGASLIGLRLPKCLSNEPSIITHLTRIAMDSIALNTLEKVIHKEGGRIELYQSLINEMERERKSNIINAGLKREIVFWAPLLFSRYKKLGEKVFELTEEEKKRIEKRFPGSLSEKILEGTKKGKEFLRQSYLKSGCKTPEEFFEKQEISFLEMASDMILLTKRPYWKAKGKFKEIENTIQKLPDWHYAKIGMFSTISSAYAREAKLDARLGAAEIGIANRIYKKKYGDYVDSLSQLTPKILPSLPLDPFSGENYIYKKKDKGFIVYSVGENLKDDGGLRRKRREKKYDILWEDKT